MVGVWIEKQAAEEQVEERKLVTTGDSEKISTADFAEILDPMISATGL